MSISDSPRGAPAAPTAAQLKGDINAGRAGDKVAGLDPAASPLGTDEEAGGARPDPALLEADLAHMATSPDSPRANAATPELAPDARMARPAIALPMLIGVLLAVVFAAGVYFLR